MARTGWAYAARMILTAHRHVQFLSCFMNIARKRHWPGVNFCFLIVYLGIFDLVVWSIFAILIPDKCCQRDNLVGAMRNSILKKTVSNHRAWTQHQPVRPAMRSQSITVENVETEDLG